MPRARETWVDDAKVVACLLVTLGHFFQSMVRAGLLGGGALYEWFEMTIYTFHVPLFFVCSGYLYQRYSKVSSPATWRWSVCKKALVLGVPYVVFTCMTLAMKAAAGDAVNMEEAGVLRTLLLRPTSPYWYLYTLFFVFVVTPTAASPSHALLLLTVSVVARAAVLMGRGLPSMPYAVSSVMRYWLWFVSGMCLDILGWSDLLARRLGLACLAFLPLSALVYMMGSGELAQLALGTVACICVLSLCRSVTSSRRPTWLDACGRLTMPVYLMHTIFAAGVRTVLLHLGISSASVHVPAGITAGLVGPALALCFMERLTPLDFVVYPARYIPKRSS